VADRGEFLVFMDRAGAVAGPIPPAVAKDLVRLLVLALETRVRADGGEVGPAGNRVLMALMESSRSTDPAAVTTATIRTIASNPSVITTETIELTVAEAAERVGCKPDWIRKLRQSGKITGRRVGQRTLLVNAGSLDDYFRGAHDQTQGRRAG
jgi:excisionase family DNA binding protein